MILAVWLADLITAQELQRRREARTAMALAQAKEALLGFASIYRDRNANQVFGYLPCPDRNNNGLLDVGEPPPIVNDVPCGNAGESIMGRLPYRTLGLPDLRDDEGECLWYAVSGSFKDNPKAAALNWMNWDGRGQFGVVDSSGTTLVGVGGTSAGAVAVIIAPGRPIGLQSRSPSGGPCAGGSNDFANFLDGGYAFPNSGNVTFTQGKTSSPTNNDRMVWITPREIFERVKRRADFRGSLPTTPGHINTLIAEVTACIVGSGLSAPPYQPANPGVPVGSALGPKFVGLIPPSSACSSFGFPTADMLSYWDNWRDQFRYALCQAASGQCLSAAGTPCRAAVIFGGEPAAGQARFTSTDRALAENYLEGINLGVFQTAGATTLTAPSSFTIPDPKLPVTTDVIACIP